MRGQGTILVLEPDLGVRALVTDYFTEKGHRVLGAGDIDEALGAMQDERPDLVLLDADLLGGYAAEALRRVHREQPNISIIRVSGTLDRALGSKAVQVIDLDRLGRAVAFAMGRRSAVNELSSPR
jgi:DNA-binding response OmpR family regulator